MIPKRIFYVWGANEPKKRDVLACIQSWIQNCHNYEIIEINENSIEYFNFAEELRTNKWFKTVFEKKMWAYVADYIRIKVLYSNGGIYLDTDVMVLKNFDKFLNTPAFVGMQDNAIEGKDDFVEPAILGSQKNNPFFKSILEIYQKEIWSIPIYTMPDIFKYCIEKYYSNKVFCFKKRNEQITLKYQDVHIFPERFFIPFRINEEYHPRCVLEDTHTIHWWGGSWIKPEILSFLKNKHKIPLDILEKNSLKSIKFKLLNLTLFKLNAYKETIRFWKIPLLKISKTNVSKGKYTQILCVRLFNIIPLYSIQKKNDSFTLKYTILNLFTFKISHK